MWQRQEFHGRPGAGQFPHQAGQVEDGEFSGIAKIDRQARIGLDVHEPQQAIDQVGDVAEGSRLPTVAEYSQRSSFQCLHDQIRDDAAVGRVHSRAVSVEDASDTHIDHIGPQIIEAERLCRALAFVVAGARASAVHMAEIILVLRMLFGIAIDLAR
ncbi:hypothetical protein LCM4577_07420 [Mesorhizobium sp. LCM 4577]|nr:hypothetical protein LCM4576_01095 [Mesorhizobium sp. LCM 4576]OHV70347.1 hypothetical protein LCM4577_07420 [Mesorhizobium sp. LCM 4577]